MRTREPRQALAWCLLAIMASGCASSSAPRGWLPKVTGAQTDAFGAWIVAGAVKGELIAVEHDSVFVLTPMGLLGLPQSGMQRAEITYYEPDAHNASIWATLGALSSASHGYGVVLSLPIWVITGVVSTHSVASAARMRVLDVGWPVVAGYARFPRGFPAGLDRGSLRMR